jgi:hypothetical protein
MSSEHLDIPERPRRPSITAGEQACRQFDRYSDTMKRKLIKIR